MQLIEPPDLVEGVRTQVENILNNLFLWTQGLFRYVRGPLPSADIIHLPLSTENIILEGIRRIESWERIWEAVGGGEARYRPTGSGQQLLTDLHLSLEEWTLLSYLEQPIDLLALCEASPLQDFEICRLVWVFLALGIIKRDGVTAPAIAAPASCDS